MISGINYPWTIFQDKPNYGCDFGWNKWNSHAGVTAHLDEVRADFESMASAGYEVTRWFVFTDGRGGVEWNASGELIGIAERFLDDMDAALDISASTKVRLCLVLVDFAWIDDPVRRAALESPAFVERVLDPFLDRYGANMAIHSLDVINEPDWVTEGLTTNWRRGVWPIDNLRAFVGGVSNRIHAKSRALVTLGGGRVRNAKEWDDPAYGLDFVQVHSYPDVRYPDRDELLFGRTAASFALTKPLLIGECPSDPRRHPDGHLSPAYTLDDYLALARDGGYLGAWPWSFKGVDAFGAVACQYVGVDQTSLIRDFLQQRFRSPQLAMLGPRTPLFSSGIVDSFGVLELIAFLEDTFGIVIDTARHDLLEFDTLEQIELLVSRQREGA